MVVVLLRDELPLVQATIANFINKLDTFHLGVFIALRFDIFELSLPGYLELGWQRKSLPLLF